jgi:hypothetical protein
LPEEVIHGRLIIHLRPGATLVCHSENVRRSTAIVQYQIQANGRHFSSKLLDFLQALVKEAANGNYATSAIFRSSSSAPSSAAASCGLVVAQLEVVRPNRLPNDAGALRRVHLRNSGACL